MPKLEKVAILSFTYLFVFCYYLLTLFYYNYSYFSFTFTFLTPFSSTYTHVRIVRTGSYSPDNVSPCFNTKLMITIPRRNLLIADLWREFFTASRN